VLTVKLAAMAWLAGAGGGLQVAQDQDVVGKPAPEWDVEHWLNSRPLRLRDLRKKVVLVRWFMSPACPFCSASAPSLGKLWRDYKDRGLVVVGMYHHKERTPLDAEAVAGYVRHFGFEFPVAIDPDWRTLRRWWLDGHDRPYTSVTFLIGRDGIIRHVHPGGRLVAGSADFAELQARIEELLAAR
jgi:peroxiredoxin